MKTLKIHYYLNKCIIIKFVNIWDDTCRITVYTHTCYYTYTCYLKVYCITVETTADERVSSTYIT